MLLKFLVFCAKQWKGKKKEKNVNVSQNISTVSSLSVCPVNKLIKQILK